MEKLIIVGGGPAGYTAAIYAARSGLRPLVIEGFQWGGQLMNTTAVENYPGYPQGDLGPDLMRSFRAQAERFGARFITDDAEEFKLSDGEYQRVTVAGEEITSNAVILSMGAEAKRLGVPGELELIGRGVSTCATCDGALFQGDRVAVIGGGDSAAEEALFLARFASQVTLIHRRDDFRASRVLMERVRAEEKIDIKTPHTVQEFVSENGKLTSLKLKNSLTFGEEEMSVGGAFVAVGHIPRSELVREEVECDSLGYVRVASPSSKTNLQGVFAVGDLTDPTYRQAVTAAGSGCVGALDAERYLSSESL